MHITIPVADGELVPAILQLPRDHGSVPGVLLIHGLTSHKERMAESIGRALGQRGVASLAMDLPLHGTRGGTLEGLSLRNPLAVVQQWRLAVREANCAIDYLAEHPSINRERIGIAGYSLGSYLALTVAANNRRVRAIALAAGGDLPADLPFIALLRTIADPRRDARALAGRPLLMVNGRSDRRIRPDQARALFEAAAEPKELRWYDGGHWPPPNAIDASAEWLADRLAPANLSSS